MKICCEKMKTTKKILKQANNAARIQLTLRKCETNGKEENSRRNAVKEKSATENRKPLRKEGKYDKSCKRPSTAKRRNRMPRGETEKSDVLLDDKGTSAAKT